MTSSVTAAQNAAIQQQIGVALAAKQLQAVKSQGQAAVALIQSAGQVGKALGRGQQFDAVG